MRKLCPDSRKEKFLEGAFKEIAQNELKNMPDEVRKKIISFDKIYEGVFGLFARWEAGEGWAFLKFFTKLRL